MNKNKIDKVTPRERVYLLSEIAEREKIIKEQREEIAYYKRQTEIAIQRRFKDRHNRNERRKDIYAWAVFVTVTAFAVVPFILHALVAFWEWGNAV